MRLGAIFRAALVVAIALTAPASAQSFTAQQLAAARAGAQKISELNVIVFGNASEQSEIEGKAWVGGDLNMAANVAPGAMANGQGYLANSALATLTVGGNAGNGVHIRNGIGVANVTANIGGNSSGNYFDGTTGTLNAGGTISGLNGTGTGNAGVSGLQASIQSQTATLSANLSTLSAVLASYAANTTFNSSDPNNLNFSTASTSNLLVANVAGNTLSGGTLFLPALAAGQMLIVNVSGDNLNMFANPQNGTPDNQNIIWNFTGGGTMNFHNWNGSILAVNAAVANSSQLNGSLVAASFAGNGEVHLGTFGGSLDTLLPGSSRVPEPASWAMMLTGFGVIGGVFRRQRRRGDMGAAID